MKNLALLAGLLLSSAAGYAGEPAKPAITHTSIQRRNLVLPERPRLPVMRAGSYVFTAKELSRLPQRNVNSVAGLVPGVDSRNGQVPNIRGARPEGTAYYVDGIRVYEY